MSTPGSPKPASLSLPDHTNTSAVVTSNQTTSEQPPELQQKNHCTRLCAHHLNCEEETLQAQIHDTSREAVDHDITMLPRAPSDSHFIETNVRPEEVVHPNDEDIVLGSDEPAREEDHHEEEVQECPDSVSGLAGLCVKPEQQQRRVAVTGAGGFIASWIVKLLLQRGFWVRGTLRNTDDENTAHLRSLEGASERLELVRANILHLPSLVDVVEGCEGVFHTACPVPPTISDPEVQMLRPAVEGTLNVMRACAQAHVKRVVMTSSIGAVYMNPNSSNHQVFDESCWSDENYLKEIQEWYCLAKVVAERAAWEYAGAHDVDLVTVCPGVTLGTMLQPRINQSSMHVLKYLDGSTKTYANLCQAYVDVEDAAEAHVLAFVTPSASGRYLCCNWSRHRGDVVRSLARLFPQFPIPTRCKDKGQPEKVPLRFCNLKVEQQLGLQFLSFDQTLQHTVHSLQAHGMLLQNKPPTRLNSEEHCPHASNCTEFVRSMGSIIKTTPPKAKDALFPSVGQARF